MDHVVAALGQRLDDRRKARHTEPEAGVERDLDLGHRAETPVNAGVSPDHFDIESRDATVANLLDRVCDSVRSAQAVGDQGDAGTIAVAVGELGLLAAEEGSRRGVGDRRKARTEQRGSGVPELERPAVDLGHEAGHGLGELALVDPPPVAVEVVMTQLALLEQSEQSGLIDLQVHCGKPRTKQRTGIPGPEVGAPLAASNLAFVHQPRNHLQHGSRVGGLVGLAAEASDRQGHRRVRPLGRASLGTVGVRTAGADVLQEPPRAARARGLGERAADIDSGVVI